MLKSYGVGGGPCDFSVSPSPFGLDFGTLYFGTSDSGLTINNILVSLPENNERRSSFNWSSGLRSMTEASSADRWNPVGPVHNMVRNKKTFKAPISYF